MNELITTQDETSEQDYDESSDTTFSHTTMMIVGFGLLLKALVDCMKRARAAQEADQEAQLIEAPKSAAQEMNEIKPKYYDAIEEASRLLDVPVYTLSMLLLQQADPELNSLLIFLSTHKNYASEEFNDLKEKIICNF